MEGLQGTFSSLICVGKELSAGRVYEGGMRRRGLALRRDIRSDRKGAVASVATILMVAIVVAMISVVGIYVFTIVRIPDDPPEIKTSYSKLNDRWSASITRVDEDLPLNNFRLVARDPDMEYVTYDSNGDGVADSLLVGKVQDLAVTSGDGPQTSPVVLVDADGDGRLSVGDSIVAYAFYYYPSGPLMDADRGYAMVGPNPDGIPKDSDLKLVASRVTLANPDIHFGDTVRVEIWHGAMHLATLEGAASNSGTYVDEWHVPAGATTGNYDAKFIIRPGEGDEWIQTYSFRVDPAEAISAGEAEAYYDATHPLANMDIIQLVHVPSNSIVLEFAL